MSHFDIRNRDMSKKISFKYLWIKQLVPSYRNVCRKHLDMLENP